MNHLRAGAHMAEDFSSSELTKAGADHVRLVYHYLDRGDFDAYASLLDEEVWIRGLAARPAHGRPEATLQARSSQDTRSHHDLYKIIADGDTVVAVGGYRRPAPVEFADVFTLADNGLLLCHRRFLAPTQ